MALDPALLEILACPICEERPPLVEVGDYLECTLCSRRYPIVNGIPHLLPESAIEPESHA